MDAHIVCNQHEDREAWLRARKTLLGASDSPGVLCVRDAWSDPPSIYLDKISDEIEDPEDVPPYVEFGSYVEPFALARLAKNLGKNVLWELDGNLYRSKVNPWQGCTVDGTIMEPIGHDGTSTLDVDEPISKMWSHKPAEVKTTAFEDKYTTKGRLPEDVWVQCQKTMAVGQVPSMYCTVLYRVSMAMNWTEVYRDDAFIDEFLNPAEALLWECIVAKDPSELKVTASERCTAALAKIAGYNPAKPPAELGAEGDEWAEQIEAGREWINEKEAELDLIKNKVRKAIGDRERGYSSGGRYFNYKWQDRKAYPVAASRSRPLTGPFGKGF